MILKIYQITFISLLVLVGQTVTLNAQEVLDNFTPVRPKAMGGAFTAIANDKNSLWTNPGGIGRIRKHRSRQKKHLLSIPNIVGGFNDSGKSFYSRFKTASSNSSSEETTSNNIKEAAKEITKSSSPAWARLAINPVIFYEGIKNVPMAFGIFTNSHISITPSDEDEDKAQIDSTTDVGLNLAFGLTNNVNRLNIGLQVRPIARYTYDSSISYEDLSKTKKLSESIKNNGNKLSSLAIDIGILYTLADFWFPTIGLSILNVPLGCQNNYLNPYSKKRETICGTKFTGTINNPESLHLVDPTDFRLGLSITPRVFHKFALRIALDLHQLAIETGASSYGLPGVGLSKQFHAGIELFYGNPLLSSPFSVRAGINQGFLTYGLSFNLSWLYIEIASYGQEISIKSTSQEDRRFLFALSLEI